MDFGDLREICQHWALRQRRVGVAWGKLRNSGKGGVKDDLEHLCPNAGPPGTFPSLDDVFLTQSLSHNPPLKSYSNRCPILLLRCR